MRAAMFPMGPSPMDIVEQFSGHQRSSFSDWLIMFGMQADPMVSFYAAEHRDRARIMLLRRYLEGEALGFFNSLSETERQDWKAVQHRMTERFPGQDANERLSVAMSEFANLRQRQDETLEAYIQRARRVLGELGPSSEDAVVNQMVDGMRNRQLAEWVEFLFDYNEENKKKSFERVSRALENKARKEALKKTPPPSISAPPTPLAPPQSTAKDTSSELLNKMTQLVNMLQDRERSGNSSQNRPRGGGPGGNPRRPALGELSSDQVQNRTPSQQPDNGGRQRSASSQSANQNATSDQPFIKAPASEYSKASKDVVCYTCQNEGHYSNECPDKGHITRDESNRRRRAREEALTNGWQAPKFAFMNKANESFMISAAEDAHQISGEVPHGSGSSGIQDLSTRHEHIYMTNDQKIEELFPAEKRRASETVQLGPRKTRNIGLGGSGYDGEVNSGNVQGQNSVPAHPGYDNSTIPPTTGKKKREPAQLRRIRAIENEQNVDVFFLIIHTKIPLSIFELCDISPRATSQLSKALVREQSEEVKKRRKAGRSKRQRETTQTITDHSRDPRDYDPTHPPPQSRPNFYATLRIFHDDAKEGFKVPKILLDNGATLAVIPRNVAKELKLPIRRMSTRQVTGAIQGDMKEYVSFMVEVDKNLRTQVSAGVTDDSSTPFNLILGRHWQDVWDANEDRKVSPTRYRIYDKDGEVHYIYQTGEQKRTPEMFTRTEREDSEDESSEDDEDDGDEESGSESDGEDEVEETDQLEDEPDDEQDLRDFEELAKRVRGLLGNRDQKRHTQGKARRRQER